MQDDLGLPAASDIVIQPFDPGHHDRSRFSCGIVRLDNFLRFSARKQQKDDFTRVFVAVADGSPRILGYYALNAHALTTGDLGADRLPRVPRSGSIPALYLSMIAVDRYSQGKGLGSDLAIDALARARNVADEVDLKLVVLDVIDDGGNEAFVRRMAFYRRLGFQSFQDRPERMFLTIDTIRAMFDDGLRHRRWSATAPANPH